jgi:integrase
MGALRGRGGVAARALEFTILTAARTGETIGARWDELDLAEKTWAIPAGRIKGGREHRVPLSLRAIEILHDLPRETKNPFVFIGPRRHGLSNMAMAAVLTRMSRDDVTVHGFRSTFRDWAAERTNFPNHIVEMALAHVVGNKVEAAYRRGDLFNKRRRLMAEWGRYCAAAPAAESSAKVVALRVEHT